MSRSWQRVFAAFITWTVAVLEAGAAILPSPGAGAAAGPSRLSEQELVMQWINDDLLGYYSFDADSVVDDSGLGNHGTPHGGLTFGDGVEGRALELNNGASGQEDYVSLPPLTWESFTVAHWVRFDSIDAPPGHGGVTFSVGDQGAVDSFLAINIDPAGNSNVILSHEDDYVGTGGVQLPQGEWHHLAATVDRSFLRYYVDGVLVSQETVPPAVAYSMVDEPAYLGFHTWWSGSGADARFNGGLDEVRLYSRALSPVEVRDVAGLMAHYSFDADSVVDDSGLGNHGTPHGGLTFGDGVEGRALELNNGASGQEDYVSLPPLTWEAFTIAHWVRFDSIDAPPGHGGVTFSVGDQGAVDSSLAINIDPAGNSNVILSHEDDYVGTGGVQLPQGEWHHLAATVDRSFLCYYVDGVLVSQVTVPPAVAYSMVDEAAYLGYHTWWSGSGADARFNGGLDEVRLYLRVLSPNEIQLHAAMFADGFDDGTTASWTLTMP